MPIATSAAGVTVNVVAPARPEPGSVAVIVVAPVVTVLARPWLPTLLSIVVQPGCELLHVTTAVRSCVVLSLNVPVAVNCCW